MSTTATVNANNLKKQPIPVVPITMKIVNPDGTPTRQGQLLLEQLQTVAGMGGGISGLTTSDTPSGTMDGTNTTFTLSGTPAAGSLLLFLNGVEQLEGWDYSLTGNTITYAVPPKSDDWQSAFYAASS